MNVGLLDTTVDGLTLAGQLHALRERAKIGSIVSAVIVMENSEGNLEMVVEGAGKYATHLIGGLEIAKAILISEEFSKVDELNASTKTTERDHAKKEKE